MYSIAEQIRQLDQLLVLGYTQAYFQTMKRIIDKLETAMPTDAGPPLDLGKILQPTDGILDSRLAPLLSRVLEKELLSLTSGDPDGAPARHLKTLRQELVGFHKSEIDRLGREIDQISKGGFSSGMPPRD